MSLSQTARQRGVSAAEKYAELEAAGLERPRCKCHGDQMLWNKSSRSIEGGYWVCSVKSKENAIRWQRANPVRTREARRLWMENNADRQRKYRRIRYEANPEKYREYSRNWYADNRAKKQQYDRQYRQEHREQIREYERTRKDSLLSAGLCCECAKRPLATTTLCNECADKKITPERILKMRRREALKRKAKRSLERSLNG